MGIISSIGNNINAVNSLVNQNSGIVSSHIYKEMGFEVKFMEVEINPEDHIDKKQCDLWGWSAYSVLSMEQAIEDAGLSNAEISNPKTGLIAGSGELFSNLLQL